MTRIILVEQAPEPQQDAALALNLMFNKEGLSKTSQSRTNSYFFHSVLNQLNSEENTVFP
jgi:hypothetical protein